MADLSSIQKKLNDDPEERKKFQADPVKYLTDKGIVLSPEASKQVTDNVAAKNAAGAPTPAWSVGVVVGT